jgi:hypothetical protein
VVEVGERHDELHVVQRDQVAERVEVVGVVDARDDRALVGVVERRRERVQVGRDRRRPGAGERGDDVDALTGAREQDCRQEGWRLALLREAPVRLHELRLATRAAISSAVDA